jgi:RecB family exonuclease
LPAATVFVPRAAVAHALRKELVRADRRDVLAGTLFVTPLVAAREVLGNASIAFEEGEEALRAARTGALLRGAVPLEYFDLALLRETRGWDVGFARTIGELELACIAPDDLDAAARRAVTKKDAGRLRDVATVWRALDAAAGPSWTHGHILQAAAEAIERLPGAWPYAGPTLVAVTGLESAAESRFLKAAPGLTLMVLGARPKRSSHVAQAAVTFGSRLASAFQSAPAPRPTGSERALLQSYLFEANEALDPARPRSGGPDGTVSLEEHAGVEEEVEAAVEWVARLVFEKRVPLEEIGLLLAEADPEAGILADRLARRGIACHVSGGIPACTSATGSRALAVVRGLRAHLGFDALAEVLPTLRLSAQEEDGDESVQPKRPNRLARGVARELAFGLGTVGGNPGNPRGALEWSSRIVARREAVKAAIENAKLEPLSADERDGARRQRLLENIRSIEPALHDLVEVARASVEEQPLRLLAPRLGAFMDKWLLAPGAGRAMLASLTNHLQALADDATVGSLVGDDALRTIEDILLGMRIPVGRFGDPGVHIDTLTRAAGLPFRALRVLGLAEGAFPAPAREDAVLPERVRKLLDAPGLSRTARATGQLHALDRILRDVSDVIVLSAPRLSADRTYHEPSSVFVEAATALGRPNASTGLHEGPVPTGRALRRDGFLASREEAGRFRHATPLTETAWQDRVALLAEDAKQPASLIPSRWLVGSHLDLQRMASLRASHGSSLDGFLGDDAQKLNLPGLTSSRALSASALAQLLRCPHQFLFERGFGWRAPDDAPNSREIDALTYGTLFHSVAELFFVEHGAAFGARNDNLGTWHQHARDIADAAFDGLLDEYPLTGEAVRTAQRERLHADVAALLEYEFTEKNARFVYAEHAFGYESPVIWPTASGPVYLAGYIDRIEVVGGVTRVRDLKTGKAHTRSSGKAPDVGFDVQVALYALVVGERAREWGLPARVSAQYVYANTRGVDLRDWHDEMDKLLTSGRSWLELASDLLHAGNLPRSPVPNDCTFCPFKAVCGDDRSTRAAAVVANSVPLQAFRQLKEEA